MDETPKIPILKKPVSLMETGPSGLSLAVAVAERHPVDTLQRQGLTGSSPYKNTNFVRLMYGPGLAMELAAERQIALREKAMGLDNIGAIYEDVVSGNDTSVQFTDFMALPDNRPELLKSVFHVSMKTHLT
jgi:Proteasome maturation factor UMP1